MIEPCVRGYQAGATVLSYLHLLLCDQREVQASLFCLSLALPSSLLYYVLHRSQHEVIEGHEYRGHCQWDRERESHSPVSKSPSLFGIVQCTYMSERPIIN